MVSNMGALSQVDRLVGGPVFNGNLAISDTDDLTDLWNPKLSWDFDFATRDPAMLIEQPNFHDPLVVNLGDDR